MNTRELFEQRYPIPASLHYHEGSDEYISRTLHPDQADELAYLYQSFYEVWKHSINDHIPALQSVHPATGQLVVDFSSAVATKLQRAEEKYGFRDNWADDNWERDCTLQLNHHLLKGDPRDVAAYCAFMWYHGWYTSGHTVMIPDSPNWDAENQWWDGYRHASKQFIEAIEKAGIIVKCPTPIVSDGQDEQQ